MKTLTNISNRLNVITNVAGINVLNTLKGIKADWFFGMDRNKEGFSKNIEADTW